MIVITNINIIYICIYTMDNELTSAIRRFDTTTFSQLLADPNINVNLPLDQLPLFEVIENIFQRNVSRFRLGICFEWLNRLLEEHNANVNIRSDLGESILHVIMRTGYSRPDQIIPVLKILFRHGINPNIQTNTGETPFHYFFINYRTVDRYTIAIFHFLLNHGADPSIRNGPYRGEHTAFDYASPEMESLINMQQAQRDVKQHNIYQTGIRSILPRISNEYGIERDIFSYLGKKNPTITNKKGRTKKRGGVKKSIKNRK